LLWRVKLEKSYEEFLEGKRVTFEPQ